jgi:glycerophosphoryl diester phosphodiesterase
MVGPPLVIAHRGASGYAVENTVEAIRLAREMGADGVEIDVHACLDGGFLVLHDPLLPDDRSIHDMSLEEAQAALAITGVQAPTLTEALACAAGLRTWVEVKHLREERDRRFLDVLSAVPDPSLIAVHSFDHRLVRRLGERQPSLQLGILQSARPENPLAAVTTSGAGTLWQEWTLLDRELVSAAREANVEVIAWTVNSAAAARHLTELGVAALCGNYPDRLRQG